NNDGKKEWITLNNITHITGKDALNGNSSLMFDVEDICSVKDDGTYNYYGFAYTKFSGMNGITDENIGGVMFRLKLLNDTTTGTGKNAHEMYLTLEQSKHTSTCVGGTSIKLFDADGKPVPTTDYATHSMGVYVPSGFDGFIFFPLDKLSKRISSTSAVADITSSFDMQIWFATTKNWAGVDAVFDDISLYKVADRTIGLTETDALNAIKAHGYNVKWAQQPAAYDLSLDFEDYMRPFDTMSSVYNGTPTLTFPTEAEFVKGNEALSGDTSLKFTAVRNANAEAEERTCVRAESSWSKFNGIEGLDKDSIANGAENCAYLTMRIKVPTGAKDGGYQFNIYAKQDGVTENAITRLRAEYGYTIDGEYITFAVKDGVTTLPDGFNGTIYLPFKKATSTKVLTAGVRAMYGNSYTDDETGTTLYGNDYLVDFSKEFSLRFYLPDTDWTDTVLYIDDIMMKCFEIADFDNSGNVDAEDVLTLKRYILGAIKDEKIAYDLNGDGYINVIDVVRIKRIIAGLVEG
ncbi:MAG: dockerin type I repeat-containing protein, partial [Clostridia bacterium]|nr:dockerin type I repeat-containing protein [Clostridia bacterium]